MRRHDITEQYEPELKTLEMEVIQFYRANPALVDHNVDKVYEGIQRTFEKELQGKNPPRLRWKGPEESLYERLIALCRVLIGEATLQDDSGEEINLDAPVAKPEMVRILKRLRSSIKTWTGKARGRTGYLDYVGDFFK